MTAEQARLYFRKKLLFDIESFSADLVSQVLRAYTVNNLVDVKRILTEAMSIKDTAATTACTTSAAATEGSVKEDFLIPQTLLNGATVTVTKMPSALQQGHQSPEEIESILRTKCNERSKDSHPHASLYKLFRDNGADTRAITRQGMHKLLIQLDIITNDRDFDAFFAKHDRGDGSIDIHAFLKRLLPPESADSDPYVPKDATALHKELVFTQALRQVTGYQREVGNLNGTTNFRLDKDFLDEVGRAVKPVETVRWQLPDEEHRSVEDLLQHLRQKRIEMEAEKAAAIGRPGSPRAEAASSAGPASRSSVRPSSPRASGGVSAVAGAAPGNGATPSAACEVGNNQDNQIVNATAVRPSSRNVALRFDDESTIASAVHNHFPPSALRPGSAPSGRRVTGTQLSKSLPARRGDEKDDQPPLCEININGSKVEPQRSVSPTQAQKSTTLQVGLPDRDRDYLNGALQSSLRNALRDMALQENPASTFVGTGGENQGEEQVDRPVRPMSASATVRPRSSNSTSGSRVLDCFSTATSSTLDSSAQQRAQHSMLLKQALNNNSTDNGAQPRVVNFAATSSTAATVPALPSCVTAADLSTITTTATTLSSTPREPIEIVSRYNQQVLRPSSASASVAKRPSTAPASRVRASPRLVVSASNSKNADTHNISAGNCSATVIAVPTGPETEELSQDVAPRPAKENKKKVVVPSLAGIGDATFSLHGAPPAPQAPEPPSVQQQQAHLEDCLYVLDPHYGSGAHHTYHSHTSRASPRVTQQLGRTTFATSVSGTRSPVRAPDASARFVYTGQRRTVRTDPMSARLVCMYKISKNHTITTNHEYGVFASSYARSMRRNANLHGKQQDAAFSAGVNTC